VAPEHVKVVAGITSMKREHGMLDWVRGARRGCLVGGRHGCRVGGWYFSTEQKAVATKRVWLATVTNGVLLQVIRYF
jgi:hypothetical protein